MNVSIFFTSIAVFAFVVLPVSSIHASGDPYADSVYHHTTIGVDDPEALLGAPDSDAGLIIGANNYVTLDMGNGEEGTGDLKVYFGPLAAGTVFTVWFLGDDIKRLLSTILARQQRHTHLTNLLMVSTTDM